MKFDEFRQALLSGGLGLQVKEAKDLFRSLSGATNGEYADIDMLLNYLGDTAHDGSDAGRVQEPFKVTDLATSVSYADRRMQESMRKVPTQKLSPSLC